ncbi:MAG TPA: HAMP domain-containing sensor histidine kinase [Candidatus Competibacteraceae bacterium]|nr:HAMP domain-containing sensor histidine kinase [Candidatus Competibacteraceae bacterium]
MASATGWPKMTRFRATLRTRFVSAVFLLVVLICGGFFYAVHYFVEVLEAELMETAVKRELHELVDAYRRDPTTLIPHTNDLQGYIVQRGESSPETLPPALLSWTSGRYDEIKVDGQEFYVGREDVDNQSLFIVLDLARIESLEARLISIAYMVILSALIAAVVVGYLLSRLVMKPVSQLVGYVAALEPGAAQVRLGEKFGDQEMGRIAKACDHYQERIGRFIDRERAFTDDASHELRTPLAVVLSALPLLQEETALTSQGTERLARIERAARQMELLIAALLALAREDEGWRAEPCHLEQVLNETAEAFRPFAEQKSLELACTIDQPVTVLAPPGMATCVVGNLLGNAIQHTQQGRILLRLQADRIIVEDTGPGIADAELSHIFERRYRGASSQGLGIGLYLVRRICERLGWTIEVQSAPGVGTCIEVLLKSEELTKI